MTKETLKQAGLFVFVHFTVREPAVKQSYCIAVNLCLHAQICPPIGCLNKQKTPQNSNNVNERLRYAADARSRNAR